MANKVISIKLDEKDIERLKKYHKALKGLGIISERTLTMNGLYKHLLLDYLEYDAYEMVCTCKKYGLFPHYISPEEIDRGSATFVNPYNLNKELYDVYVQCIKEAQVRGINKIERSMDLINEVTNNEGCFFEEETGDVVTLPREMFGEPADENSFWLEKASEEQERFQASDHNNMQSEFAMIEESLISQEEKERLIEAIENMKMIGSNILRW